MNEPMVLVALELAGTVLIGLGALLRRRTA